MTVQQSISSRVPSPKYLAVLLFLSALVLNLAGNGRISLWDRDEPRFSQAAHQMLDSGDYVVPQFNDGPRYDKPVLIYWLMDGAIKAFGVNEFSVRLPAALAGAGTVLIIFLLALGMGCGPESATLAALITMTSVLTMGVAKAATTDGVLTLTVAAMMALLWRQRQRGFSWGAHLALYAVLGASALLKGPPGVMVFVTAAAGDWLWRWWLERGKKQGPGRGGPVHAQGIGKPPSPNSQPTTLGPQAASAPGPGWGRTFWSEAGRWGAAAVVLGLVTVPWTVLAWQRTGGEYFNVAVRHHVLDRMSQPLESHGGRGVLGYLLFLPLYLPVLAVGLFPWTAPALLALRSAWRRRGEPARRFLWCWLVPSFVAFSLVATKLPHYIAPLLPAVALMTGLWWEERRQRPAPPEDAPAGWWKSGAVLTGLFGVMLAGGILGLAIYLKRQHFGALLAPAIPAAAAVAGGNLWGAWQWLRRKAGSALAVWGATMALASLLLFLWALPAVEPLKPSKRVVGWVKEHAPSGTRLLAAEYKEPTLVFYWGRPVEMLADNHPEKALPLLNDKSRPAALIITKKRWEEWKTDLPELGRVMGEIRYQYSYFAFQRGTWGEMVVLVNW